MDTITFSKNEQELLKVVRRLPAERVSQLVEFAEFLEFQMRRQAEEDWSAEDHSDEMDTADEKWDALLATEESQTLLEKMADEAWDQIQAGQSRLMVFTEDGKIAPG
jgi:hypothetical protein